jgi:RNA polymerase sigma-70 factor (ECF subfamily)
MIVTLPEIYRQPLLLSEIGGMKQAEVAGQLGLSVSGAKSRIQRGRAMLKQSLLDCCHFEFDRRGSLIDYLPRQDCCEACSC